MCPLLRILLERLVLPSEDVNTAFRNEVPHLATHDWQQSFALPSPPSSSNQPLYKCRCVVATLLKAWSHEINASSPEAFRKQIVFTAHVCMQRICTRVQLHDERGNRETLPEARARTTRHSEDYFIACSFHPQWHQQIVSELLMVMGEVFLLTVGAFLLTVKLLCLQSLKALIRRTFPL